MSLYRNELYLSDIAETAALPLPWEKLRGRSILLSGATGLIGSFLTDVLMHRNREGLGCTIYALSRNEAKARARFSGWQGDPLLRFVSCDVTVPLAADGLGTIDYVLHLASNTHPLQYANDPVGTILTNVTGLKNMLDFAADHGAARFVFASSNEVYGENRGDTELFDERYCGYIDPNTLRAGYPESKRCGEALCQAYLARNGLDVVIPRFTRTYGPTMLPTDSKAVSQFILRGVAGQDIVLKSAGTQYYSYTYAADAVSGLLTVLLTGETGQAYNVADPASDILLRDLAGIIAEVCGTGVVREMPGITEAAGYSVVTKARLNGEKLRALGWHARFGIREGIARTVSILRSIG